MPPTTTSASPDEPFESGYKIRNHLNNIENKIQELNSIQKNNYLTQLAKSVSKLKEVCDTINNNKTINSIIKVTTPIIDILNKESTTETNWQIINNIKTIIDILKTHDDDKISIFFDGIKELKINLESYNSFLFSQRKNSKKTLLQNIKNLFSKDDQYCWIEYEDYRDYCFQWRMHIKFEGSVFKVSEISKLLYLLSSALDSISGVEVLLESQSVGSRRYDITILFKTFIEKEQVKNILKKIFSALESEKIDKYIEQTNQIKEDTNKTKTQTQKIKENIDRLPSIELKQQIHIFELELKKQEVERKILENKLFKAEKELKLLEIKEKELDIARKELDHLQRLTYEMREGFLQNKPLYLEINNIPYIKSENGKKIKIENDLDLIDRNTIVNPDKEIIQNNEEDINEEPTED
ncbi:hypothetical protein [Myxosarcina sp. GI1]|uniref:hypothetical protein n=1 Tax=Myxosarcina sp. GI1 TaxID=1541065 RepID=UPI0005651BFE|nr:hypothetical protein [Myxosarcina sp. GI1]